MIHGFLGLLKDLLLFCRRKMREMPNVRDHFPGVFIVVPGFAEGGHPGVPDPLFDDEIDLAIRHLLRVF